VLRGQTVLRPLIRLTTIKMSAMTSKMWINPPATWNKNPSSQKTNSITMMPQRIDPTKTSYWQTTAVSSPHSLRVQAQNACGANVPSVTADLIGTFVALLLGGIAYRRSRGTGGFYDRDVYGMTARTHLRYALAALAFAVAFAATARWFAQTATVWVYAAFVLFAVFYLTSYLRGAHEDDE
jgi:hypothetical protein